MVLKINMLILFLETKIILKLNFLLTDPLKPLSPFMEISLVTNLESINILPDKLWEDMLSKLSDGELKMEPLIGKLLILGMKIGEMMDISES